MKQLLMPSVILIFGIGLIAYGIASNKALKRRQQPEIISSVTDERGLTSVIYLKGNDTLALDYLTKTELNNLITKVAYKLQDVTRLVADQNGIYHPTGKWQVPEEEFANLRPAVAKDFEVGKVLWYVDTNGTPILAIPVLISYVNDRKTGILWQHQGFTMIGAAGVPYNHFYVYK